MADIRQGSARSVIPYGRQAIDAADVEAVRAVLESEFLTQGPAVEQFEDVLAQYCGAARAVALCNATAALHVACLALDVGPGDRVWTSPITFVASANCARYCGADVDFVDIDARTGNLCTERLADKLEIAARAAALPKVVIPVHIGGQSCDMAAISQLSQRYGFRILEDASHAIGGDYRGEPVGSCRFSDIAVFSFHPVKIVTTGEGGAALTNDPRLADRMISLRSHGITRDPSQMARPSNGPWYYEQLELGFNYRMTDIQAALGVSQMGRIGTFVTQRRVIAAHYDRAFDGASLVAPWQHPDTASSRHLYVIRLAQVQAYRHRKVFEDLRAAGIGVNLHYIPVYHHPYYRGLGFEPGYCPEAERYYETAISIPVFPGLTEAEQHHVIDSVKAAVGT